MRKRFKECANLLDDHRRNACGGHLVFQNEAKNILKQAFVMNISCKFENSAYNTFCSKGGNRKTSTHCFMTDKDIPHGDHLVFQNEAKNIPRQDFVVMNICCKFENYTYNTLPSRGIKAKSLQTVA